MLRNNRKTFILTSVIILLPVFAGLILWNKLPDSMATHFSMDNEANGYSNKLLAIIGLPLVFLALHIFSAIVRAKDPRKRNMSNKMYNLVLWIAPCISIFTAAYIYAYNLGFKMDISFFTSMLIGMLLAVAGNYLPKIRQNYTMGIRLPWTLANEENWNKTHRMGGIIWMIAGIVLMIITLISRADSLWGMLGVIVISVMIPCIYSFFLHVKKGL